MEKELTHKWVDLEVTHYMQQHEIVPITKKTNHKTNNQKHLYITKKHNLNERVTWLCLITFLNSSQLVKNKFSVLEDVTVPQTEIL